MIDHQLITTASDAPHTAAPALQSQDPTRYDTLYSQDVISSEAGLRQPSCISLTSRPLCSAWPTKFCTQALADRLVASRQRGNTESRSLWSARRFAHAEVVVQCRVRLAETTTAECPINRNRNRKPDARHWQRSPTPAGSAMSLLSTHRNQQCCLQLCEPVEPYGVLCGHLQLRAMTSRVRDDQTRGKRARDNTGASAGTLAGVRVLLAASSGLSSSRRKIFANLVAKNGMLSLRHASILRATVCVRDELVVLTGPVAGCRWYNRQAAGRQPDTCCAFPWAADATAGGM